MAYQNEDPNYIGTIWLNEGKGKGEGKVFFGGKSFPVPDEGMTVDLIPFSFVDKNTGQERHGIRVLNHSCLSGE